MTNAPEGQLAGIVDAVVTLLVAAARRVARWLRPVAIAAGIAGIVVWGAVGAPLLDDDGSAPWISLLIAVLAGVPFVLVLLNRRQLDGVAKREDAIRGEINSLVGAVTDKQAVVARLVGIRERLEEGGVRELISVGHDVRSMQSASDQVRERRDAIVAAFGLSGFAGLGVAVGSAFLVMLAAPVAIVVAIVLAAA